MDAFDYTYSYFCHNQLIICSDTRVDAATCTPPLFSVSGLWNLRYYSGLHNCDHETAPVHGCVGLQRVSCKGQ